MSGELGSDIGVFVSGVVVENGMDEFAGGNFRVDGVEEADELLIGMVLHAATEHGAVEDIEGDEGRRG